MVYCSSCGSQIPEGQGKCCSMCYGDVNYGRDHYYEDWLLERMADEDNRQREQQEEDNRQREQQEEDNRQREQQEEEQEQEQSNT